MRLLPPFHVFEDFLPDQERQALLDFAVANEAQFAPTTIRRGSEGVVDPTQRISVKLKSLGAFKDRLRAILRRSSHAIFERVGMQPFEIAGIELELVAHGDGAHFGRHIDSFTGPHRHSGEKGLPTHRAVSGVYYFYSEPKSFSGGELRIHSFASDSEAAVDIIPAQNSFVVFPSFAPHEVLPVTCPSRRFADSRIAVNCWFHKLA